MLRHPSVHLHLARAPTVLTHPGLAEPLLEPLQGVICKGTYGMEMSLRGNGGWLPNCLTCFRNPRFYIQSFSLWFGLFG